MSYKADPTDNHYSKGEVLANGLTHGLGGILSIVGLVFLIFRAVREGTGWHMVSFAVFGTSLITLYLVSAVYHLTPNQPWNPILQRLDHSAITLLIAGTYTPFLLVGLRNTLGWSVFGLVWGSALVFLALKLGFGQRFSKPPVLLYLLMGWLVVVLIGEVRTAFNPTSLLWLLIGGLLYTGGLAFFFWKKLPYNHAVWHIFVMGGSLFHFFSVMSIL